MYVGKRVALVLLAVMVLWATTPALACLTVSAHRSCCQGMAMQGCASPAMMQCSDCCRVQPADVPLLPGSARTVDHALGFVPSSAPSALVLQPDAGQAILLASELLLPPGSPGVGSVLRI